MLNLKLSVVKPLRRQLKGLLRRQVLKPRVIGSKGNWGLAALRGRTVYLLKGGFKSPTAANIHCMMRFGMRAPTGAHLVPATLPV